MPLIDTDILINVSRGKIPRSALQWDRTESISDVTYMEFVQGCRNRRELDLWMRASQRFVHLPVSETISARARVLTEQFSLSHGLTLGDALIASTALTHGLVLKTGNKKHFSFVPGLKLT